MQYTRNDLAFTRGTFRVRGDTIEIFPVYEELAVRIEMFGDEIERLMTLHPLTGEVVTEDEELYVFPATHYVAGPERMERAITGIELELADRLAELERQGKLLEAQRLRMRTDLRHRDDAPGRLLLRHRELLPAHRRPRAGLRAATACSTTSPRTSCSSSTSRTSPCRRSAACTRATCRRKRTLVDHGFRLPSAMDNRPLKWEEFLERIGQTVYLSATPGSYELAAARASVEQIIRPTGLVDPEVVVKPTKGQIDDLVHEIKLRAERNERVLVTTLTKKMSEDLTDYLLELGIRVRYLHSEVDTLRRVELLRELRLGEFDVLVGINLLREGLDLPEVSLVSILDADKEGFLRSGTSLIQTIGRAARNVSGQVHMYADTITDSMAQGDRRDQPAPGQAGRLQRRARRRPAAAAQADRRHHRPARPRGRRHRGADRRRAAASSPAARRRCPGCRSQAGDAGRHAARAGRPAGGRAGRPDPAAHRPDARGGRRAAVRARRPAARRDRRAEEGAARHAGRRLGLTG